MVTITAMDASHYDQMLALWLSVPELRVSPAFDSHERIMAYLLAIPNAAAWRWMANG